MKDMSCTLQKGGCHHPVCSHSVMLAAGMDQTPSFEKEPTEEEEAQKEDPAELKKKQLLQRVQGLIDTTSACTFDYICQASALWVTLQTACSWWAAPVALWNMLQTSSKRMRHARLASFPWIRCQLRIGHTGTLSTGT